MHPGTHPRPAPVLTGWAGLGGIALQLALLHLPPGAAPDRYQDGISAPAAVKLQASMLLPVGHPAPALAARVGIALGRQAGVVHLGRCVC